ncbi:MAG TPA: hypothetical protein VNR18_00785 [Hyphomicrobiales bacterium]|nr:hypothetical protein [Hyphomicrobiales bacterium]
MNRHASWLARVAASAAVRRLVYLAIAAVIAAVLSFVPTGKAQAQSGCYGYNNIDYECPNREIAYVRAQESVAEYIVSIGRVVQSKDGWSNLDCDATRCRIVGNATATNGVKWRSTRSWAKASECPAGNAWNDEFKQCAPSQCADAPDHGGAMAKSFNMCKDGCRYEQAAPGGVNVCMGSGADMTCMATNWKATGARCEPNDKPPQAFDPNQETCRSLGGGAGSYAECVKPNGDHCVTSASGAVLCWKPSDIGDRITTDGKVGGDREVAPATPTPPENMSDPTQVTTTTTTIGGTTYNTSIYNGTGNNGGQGNVGEGGKNTGGTGDPKGEGEGGNGKGEGEGDNDWGTPGAGVGDQYQGTDKTVGSVYGTFKGRVEGSPLVGAATGFFSGCSGGGSCPSETWDGGDYAGQHDLSALCSGALSSLLAYAGWVCLAGMGAVGFRIALL